MASVAISEPRAPGRTPRTPASAQLGNLKRAIKKVEKNKKKKTTKEVTKSNTTETSVSNKVTKKSMGRIVFSKQLMLQFCLIN